MASNRAHEVRIALPCKSESLQDIKRAVLAFSDAVGLSPTETADLRLSIMEAMTNAIRHSNAGLVNLGMCFADGFVSVEVVDDGRGFAFHESHLELPPPTSIGGWGIPLMNILMDELVIESAEGKGTCIRMSISPKNSE